MVCGVIVMSYNVKETADTVKEQFALYYPVAMEWIADNVKYIHCYNIKFPNTIHDEDHGVSCKFTIAIYLLSGQKVILESSYGFSTDCEVGMYYSEVTLKQFNNWTGFVFGGGIPDIPIGKDNPSDYIKHMDKIVTLYNK